MTAKFPPRRILWPEPTPLERYDRLAEALGLSSLYIKRDDANGIGLGGNKVRQLEYYLGDALSRSADTILMTGAVQSNFVRTAAAACAKLGLECHVQLENRVSNGSDAYKTSGNVLLNRIFGAHIHHYPHGEDEAGADRQLLALAEQLKGDGRNPCIVHMHPSHPPLGALGYVDCANELDQQFKLLDISPERIFTPSGSGNTHGGLVFGLRQQGSSIPVTGVCVRRPSEAQFPRLLDRFAQIAELLKTTNPVSSSDLELDDRFLPPGYGEAGKKTLEAIELAGSMGGLVLDPVYTGKTFAALVDYAHHHRGADLVFIHTGGAPSIFGYADIFSEFGSD